MLQPVTHAVAISLWLSIVTTLVASAALSGVSITIGTSALLLIACIAPPAVMLILWREPPPAVAELRHSVERRA